MPITSFEDALKTLAQSLQLSTILPSLMLVLTNVIFVFPRIWPEMNWELSNLTVVISITSVAIILSYLLYAFNHPLIRLFEGYESPAQLITKDIMENAYYEQMEKFKALNEQIETHGLSTIKGIDALQQLDNSFPTRAGYVLPTALGNVIAAFEDYPYTRYGIDAVAMWPRLVPILKENEYLDFVAQQKSVFDFLLNLTVVILICGVELTYLAIYLNQIIIAIICGIATFWLFRLLYFGAVNGAMQWGYSIRVAFDLYRWDLWNLLRLKPVRRYRDEVKRWQVVSDLFVQGGVFPKDFDIFVYETVSDKTQPRQRTKEEKETK